MASIFDLLGGMPPEQNQGLLAAAAQVLRNSGPGRPYSFGQGLGDAIGAYQGNMEYQKQRKVKDQFQALELEDAQMGLDEKKRARDLQRQIEAAAQGAYRTAGQQAASLPGGPTAANAERIGEFKDGMDVDAFINNVARFAPLQALEYRKMFAKAGPKFDAGITWVNGPDGRPMAVRTADDGSIKQLDGLAPREKLQLENLGGRSVAVNPYELTPGQEFKRTMTPGEIAANSLGWANNRLSRERFNHEKQTEGPGGAKAPAGYRWAADGNLEAIPGGPATKGATATEGERKAATLLQRLQFSEGQLEAALKDSPGAATPNLLAQGLRGIGAEAAANSATSEARQRVDTAQLDILDAALTLGTGAAYTKEQLEGYRKSYFPQIGDSEGTIKDKQARLNNIIEAAKLSAGRAAPAVHATAPASIPQGAINHLKMNPKLREQFDAKYGAGAAASILGR